MNVAARKVQRVIIWLPTALILGINTLFLLDGGLNNVQAFAANAFYTIGLAVFELPTGMFADTFGRRTSFLIGIAVQLVGSPAATSHSSRASASRTSRAPRSSSSASLSRS